MKSHSNREHAILSPSSFFIALNCPGSVTLKEKLPPEAPSAAAKKGTRCHEAAEKRLTSFLEAKINGGGEPFIYDTDQEIAKVAEGWTEAIWNNVFNKSITGKAYALEDRLTYSEKLSMFGTADAWVVSTDERANPYGVIADLKSGFVYVEADKNPQLAAYAVFLRKEIRDGGKELSYVRAGIFQPFAEGEKYRETKFTSKQLDAWEKKFLKLADDVYNKPPKFKVGDHCKYCPAQASCTAYGKKLSQKTSLKLIDSSEMVFPDIEQIPENTLVNISLNEDAINNFVSACKKKLMAKMLNGEKVKGVKLVEGKTRRTWDDSRDDALVKAAQPYGVNVFYMEKKNITTLEKELGSKIGAKEAKELITQYTKQTTPSIKLVSASDPRPEVKDKMSLLLEE